MLACCRDSVTALLRLQEPPSDEQIEVVEAGMQEPGWTGMPEPTDEQIEREAVSTVGALFKWKKRYDRPGAKWTAGTTSDADKIIEEHDYAHTPFSAHFIAQSSWHPGSARRAALELAEHHGMVLEGVPSDDDNYIYVFVDRSPTRQERAQREKEPLTIKQKQLFRKIRKYAEGRGRGPTRSECARMSGHRSTTTTNGLLEILARKNWIILEPGQRSIELI